MAQPKKQNMADQKTTEEQPQVGSDAWLGVGFEGEAYTMKTLIHRAISMGHYWDKGAPRWSGVGRIFSVGSTTAIAMCKAAGVDPHLTIIPDDDEDA